MCHNICKRIKSRRLMILNYNKITNIVIYLFFIFLIEAVVILMRNLVKNFILGTFNSKKIANFHGFGRMLSPMYLPL